MKRSRPDLPAILGGSKAVTLDHGSANKWPDLDQRDEQAVLRILREGNISTHPVIRELESAYAAFGGRKYALAHNNGTAALLTAFHAIGLKPGDEVLVPSATFWASVLPMLWLGAVPVFCESETDRMGIDPADAERRITGRTRAIVVVHIWGHPCKMTELFRIADRHGLKIVEDASHAHGAAWRGRPCGSLGDVSVFSLQGDKLAPAGEGGILLCDRYEYFERALCLGDITRIIELETPARRLAGTSLGIKTRIAPLSAAIGINQLRRLPDHNALRNRNLVKLSHALEKLGFHAFLPPDHIDRVYFEFLVRRRAAAETGLSTAGIITALQAEGCRVSAPRYPLLHQQPFFTEGLYRSIARLPQDVTPPSYHECSLPTTEAANKELIKLPSFPGPDNGILEQYIQAFEKVMSYADEIAAADRAASQKSGAGRYGGL